MKLESLIRGFLAAAVLAHAGVLAAQPPIGAAYGVGFRVVHEDDNSRTVGPRQDFEGRQRAGRTARHMQIAVWYPARVDPSARRMSFGDYLILSATRDGERPITETDRTSGRDGLKSFAGFGLGRTFSDSQAAAVYNRRMDGVRDATPMAGRFPVVIAGTDGSVGNQALLWEALARHGYVVIASASLPALAAVQVTTPAAAIDTRVRDLEYLTAHARQYAFADTDRLAVLGVNFDGMAALIYQMKNMRADAVVSIDGWEGKRGNVATVRASPYYDARRMRAAYFLALQNDSNPPPGLTHDLSIFDELKYATGEHVVFRGLTHAFLVGSGATFSDISAEQRAAFALHVRRVSEFLDVHLRKLSAAAAPADAAVRLAVDRRHAALKAVPDGEEVERVVMGERGAERLRDVYREARRANPDVSLFSRSALNLFAFRMSRGQRVSESLILLELATEAFPQSALAQNDLGNAYLQAADTTRAAQAFERSLAMLPADTSFSNADRDQSRAILEQKLALLRRKPQRHN